MSCAESYVARKIQSQSSVCSAAEVAVFNLRKAVIQLADLRLAPRVRKIPHVRRRLPVLMLPSSSQSVIIRHADPNLGSAVNESPPVQSQRA